MKINSLVGPQSIAFSQNFSSKNVVDFSPKGIISKSTVITKSSADFKVLPVKFKEIDGDFVVSVKALETLKNFPEYVSGDIKILRSNLKSVTLGSKGIPISRPLSMANPTPIKCHAFVMDGVNVIDLDGCTIEATDHITLINLKNLKSIDGFLGRVKKLYIQNCPNLKTEFKNISFADEIFFGLKGDEQLPLVKILLFSGGTKATPVPFNPKLREILNKYTGKGPDVALEMIRELRDAGFKNLAWI